MNSAGFIVALVALIVVACAIEVSAGPYLSEHKNWLCNVNGGRAVIKAEGAELSGKDNNAVCKKTCKGTYPRYKKGNWALFTDGLFCCCSTRIGSHPYGEREPYVSQNMKFTPMNANPSSPTD